MHFMRQHRCFNGNVKTRIKDDIKETPTQTKSRLEHEFEALEMGKRGHSDFRSLFEKHIDDMEEHGCKPDEGRLCRAYMSKISHDLRVAVHYREWRLDDGPEQRQPVTWEEVARCVSLPYTPRNNKFPSLPRINTPLWTDNLSLGFMI